ncbi:peptidyl-prolyl cis-trans isomerase [Viridothelium virens]|uniref:peptidylprolyl isomerase n=1 Tax=Viridothelium virens TaxID=1048519 RepID=A0A6A6HCC1_VIRVR|nr:peptidyl-prolyl cis-trans isomerase [Viridothelium virens]
MGVDKRTLRSGNGQTFAKAGDNVTIEYTGYLYDPSQQTNGFRGKKFDSSVGRGDFITPIGVGRVIKGWDDGILKANGGMSLGEKATLTISSDFAYGERGFPGHIPPNATLVFDVELLGINDKKA